MTFKVNGVVVIDDNRNVNANQFGASWLNGNGGALTLNASNFTQGYVPATTLPPSGVGAGGYNNPYMFYFNSKGQITAIANCNCNCANCNCNCQCQCDSNCDCSA